MKTVVVVVEYFAFRYVLRTNMEDKIQMEKLYRFWHNLSVELEL